MKSKNISCLISSHNTGLTVGYILSSDTVRVEQVDFVVLFSIALYIRDSVCSKKIYE